MKDPDLEPILAEVEEVREMLRDPEPGGGAAECSLQELDAIGDKLTSITRAVDAAARRVAINRALELRDYERCEGVYGEEVD